MPPPPTTVSTPSPPSWRYWHASLWPTAGSTKAVLALHTLFPFGDNRGKALGIAQEDAESGPLTLNFALLTLTETGFTAKFARAVPHLCHGGNLQEGL